MSHNDSYETYSRLELVRQDTAAQAPERDHLTNAPEVDQASSAPQRLWDSGPQLALSESALISAGNAQKEALTYEDDSKQRERRKLICRLSRKSLIMIASLILLAVVGVGVGVGVSLRSKTDVATKSPLSNQPEHGILNDSSFAAVTTADATRHVFFQDVGGSLRQAVHSDTTQAWLTAMSFVIPNTTDARPNTPLSASIQTHTQDNTSQIVLLYISANHRLAATSFNNGLWTNTTTFFNVSQYSAFSNSRSLSLLPVPTTNGSSQLLLFFEDSNGNITGLSGVHNALPFFNPAAWWTWGDITATLRPASSASRVSLGAPFSVKVANYPATYSHPASLLRTDAIFFNSNGDINSKVVSCYNNNGSRGTAEYGFLPSLENGQVVSNVSFVDTPSVEKSDWVNVMIELRDPLSSILSPSYWLWVNGTTLSFIFNVAGSPIDNSVASPFPFTRLATTSLTGSSAFYLYHQISGTVLAEDIWDNAIGTWSSTNVSILTV